MGVHSRRETPGHLCKPDDKREDRKVDRWWHMGEAKTVAVRAEGEVPPCPPHRRYLGQYLPTSSCSSLKK